MKIEHLEKAPIPPRASRVQIVHAINPVLTGAVPAIKIQTINSHRSTIKQAVAHAQERSGIELEIMVKFRHDRRAGDVTDAGTSTAERLIEAYIWKKEVIE